MSDLYVNRLHTLDGTRTIDLENDEAALGRSAFDRDLANATGKLDVEHLGEVETSTGTQTVVEALDNRVSAFTPEMFDQSGGVDYAEAIEAMLDAANGQLCLFRNSKIYPISRPLVFNGDWNIKSLGRAEIFINGQPSRIINASASLAVTTALASDIEINSREWTLASTSGVEVGMLMEVKSSISWYHDPRPESTDARKSELHKVVKVKNNIVTTELCANDGYSLAQESVEVTFYSPIKFNVENILVRGVRSAPGTNTLRSSGWRIEGVMDGKLLNAGSKDCAACGAYIGRSYNTHVIGGDYDGSNDYFTGYGVQISGSTLCWALRTKHWECRRGVDVSGANIISLHTLVRECVQTGGGYNSRGEVYGWGNSGELGGANFGFGTHGAADKTVFDGNIVDRCHTPFNSRSRNTKFTNNKITGRCRNGAFSLTYGTNCIIDSNWCDPSIFGGKNGATLGGANINSRIADSFVRIAESWQSDADNPVVITNNIVMCQTTVVELAAPVSNLTYHGNTIRFRTISGESPSFLFQNISGAAMNSGEWFVDVGSVSKFGSGSWDLFDAASQLNAGTATIINNLKKRFRPTVTVTLGGTPVSPAEELDVRIDNGIVTVSGWVAIDVTAAEGSNVTFIIDGIILPRSFISSLQANGFCATSTGRSAGGMTARTTGGNSRLSGTFVNRGDAGKTNVSVSCSYALSSAVPA